MRILEGQEREKQTGETWEVIMAEGCSQTNVIYTKPHTQESQRTPVRINTKKTPTPRYDILPGQKTKDKRMLERSQRTNALLTEPVALSTPMSSPLPVNSPEFLVFCL